MGQFANLSIFERKTRSPRNVAEDVYDLPVLAQFTVIGISHALWALTAGGRAAAAHNLFEAWVKRYRHRREIDMLLRMDESTFNDVGVARDDAILERQRSLRDFL